MTCNAASLILVAAKKPQRRSWRSHDHDSGGDDGYNQGGDEQSSEISDDEEDDSDDDDDDQEAADDADVVEVEFEVQVQPSALGGKSKHQGVPSTMTAPSESAVNVDHAMGQQALAGACLFFLK